MPRSLRPLLALAVLSAAALLVPPAASAQTPAATVKDDGGTVVLQSFFEGQLLAPGPYNSGATIPATGAGTRMMWWPNKAAFRAGTVGHIKNSDGWDPTNVGNWSIAFGRDTEATGLGAAAIGDRATSTANYATAMGIGTSAGGQGATAMGQFSTASAEGATAIGDGTTAATNHSHSIGECNDKNRGNDDGDPDTGPLFVVGDGQFGSIGCDSHSDALVLDQSGNLTKGGSLTESSDRRLKTDIEPLGTEILRKLQEIRPVRYEFKNQRTHPGGEQLGLIAQDVRKEFPSLVSESGGYLSLATRS